MDDDYVFCVNIQFLIRPFFMFTVFLICIFGVEISILVAYKLQIKVKVNKVTQGYNIDLEQKTNYTMNL